MIDYEIDPYIWFGKREVEFYPKHFVLSDTPLSMNSKQWVLDNIKGRLFDLLCAKCHIAFLSQLSLQHLVLLIIVSIV